ncbi:MAG: glutamine--fructose-6-phosphate transaminase (isomerizing) [Candidatus Sumerlaeia bacterium]|nr:glutamine--fructose-6-phosphate transaminase (isomerizing) [Candidatus Sumerlaeia bacterium]
MCGIIGCLGTGDVTQTLIEGLKRLEYRGYDSAGMAVIGEGGLKVHKVVGRVAELERTVPRDCHGPIGVAHTRWATHGAPSVVNAHPHLDCKGQLAVVHNGIVENHRTLRAVLESRGCVFRSETDSEVLAHLIAHYYQGDLLAAVRQALRDVRGTYGIAVISTLEPNVLVAARNGSPLIVGVRDGGLLVASDASALVAHTRDVVYFEDGEIAALRADGLRTVTLEDLEVSKTVERIDWDMERLERGGFDHFMLKEIHEQPEVIRNATRGRLLVEAGEVKLGGITLSNRELKKIRRIVITACGTSWHAALVGEYMLESYAHVPVEVEYASEFRYRRPLLEPDDLVIVISQSGETADTLAALREAKERGVVTVGICNVVGSTIARETDMGVYTHAGPEIGVASTKAFTAQLTVLALLTLRLGRLHYMTPETSREIVRAMAELPAKVERVLEHADKAKAAAELFAATQNCLYLGRGFNFPVALEGALKMKEISYIHAEGYPAAEMKHGPIALVDKNMPVVVIATRDRVYDKILSNIEEVRARGGRIIAVATEGDLEIRRHADCVLYVPETLDLLTPLLTVVPLQLLAYYAAVARGCDVDRPRNLAKSVTVE